jgi:hypothetical protein
MKNYYRIMLGKKSVYAKDFYVYQVSFKLLKS